MNSRWDMWDIIRGAAILALFVAAVGWVVFRTLRKSDEPIRLIYKWGLTVLIIGSGLVFIRGSGPYMPLFVLPFAITVGLLWAPSWGTILAKPLTSMFDGGDEEVEARPFYSIAEAQRSRGNYAVAVAEVQKQLAKFPNDFVGQMLLAQIQAEHLNDLPTAQLTVEKLLNQPEHSPRNIAAALQQLADWHLKYSQDIEAARQALEQIIERLPDTQFAQGAAQRIAHLASADQLSEMRDRVPIAVPHYEGHFGLGEIPGDPQKAEDPAALADQYVKHLETYPLDTEAREKLAVIYAEHYQRLDLAAGELEQLIALPHELAKHKVRWLNRLVDLQMKCGGDIVAAEKTLRRILAMFPDTAAGDNANTRLAYLKLELKGKEAGHVLKLGSYESSLGLKRSAAEQDAANANKPFRRLTKG